LRPSDVSRHSSRSRKKIRYANPILKKINSMIRKEIITKAPENPDTRLLKLTE